MANLNPASAGTPDHAHQQAAAPIAPKSTAAGGTRYTCPMHPEIMRDAPGSCPKCGMTLIPA